MDSWFGMIPELGYGQWWIIMFVFLGIPGGILFGYCTELDGPRKTKDFTNGEIIGMVMLGLGIFGPMGLGFAGIFILAGACITSAILCIVWLARLGEAIRKRLGTKHEWLDS